MMMVVGKKTIPTRQYVVATYCLRPYTGMTILEVHPIEDVALRRAEELTINVGERVGRRSWKMPGDGDKRLVVRSLTQA